LQIPLTDTKTILEQFKEIHSHLGKGTKYRAPHKLVPLIIYFYYKEQGKYINEKDLLALAKISKKDFNAFKLPMISFWPEYQRRNRMEYISRRIMELVDHYELGMPFYYQSKKILHRFYESIKNTTDNVIVGLVTSITLLCSERTDVRINNICDLLDIRMSTIQIQVKRRIFERFKVPGFKSLVKSAEILRQVMTKLGVLDSAIEELESAEFEKEPEIIHVVLGSARPIHNFHSNQLIFKDTTGYNRISITNNTIHYFIQDTNGRSKVEKIIEPTTTDVELWKYHVPVGPPIIFE